MYLCIPFGINDTSTYRYGKSPAQILIKWSVQNGYICIPKSVKEERIFQNCDIFDFMISEEDMISMVWTCNSVKKNYYF